MFWDVPGCSGLFHVPAFIDDLKARHVLLSYSLVFKYKYKQRTLSRRFSKGFVQLPAIFHSLTAVSNCFQHYRL